MQETILFCILDPTIQKSSPSRLYLSELYRSKDKERYNFNNHHQTGPGDYHERRRPVDRSIFHDLDVTSTIVIDKSQMLCLSKLLTVCA